MFETEVFKEIKQGLNIVDFFRMLTGNFFLEYKCQKCGHESRFHANKKDLEMKAKSDNANLELYWYDPKQKLCFRCFTKQKREGSTKPSVYFYKPFYDENKKLLNLFGIGVNDICVIFVFVLEIKIGFYRCFQAF